ncbi:hypothetical protein DM455_15105 [Legionella pneumophila]|nr:hypothetical protein BE843_09905 [Legionella pneumophila subsp. pneumophila]PYB42361.1 hypothetical protein DM454_15515 [Legionella pneumophila]AOW61270.1 hypothetical protein BE844_08860 [Legionella pneumophila subsp. pneumophila]AOW66669.1 hypothetical protein BE846_06630 [Legionella pneumophila subsp. pneumophila]PYB51387.1 hypothetical protein DM456_07435 [Legionella pneumophila]
MIFAFSRYDIRQTSLSLVHDLYAFQALAVVLLCISRSLKKYPKKRKNKINQTYEPPQAQGKKCF